jgi:electron-transferring-flavoprotein dehydrogenase
MSSELEFTSELTRDIMQYDIVIVGAGAAGLATAIHLKQLCHQHNVDLSVCILEKGSAIGAHILSGAVFEPQALTDLIPDWQAKDAPVKTKVTQDQFYFLTESHQFKLPTPKTFNNHGNYIISLSNLCKWLAAQAEELGIEIYPGFAAKDILIKDNYAYGVLTNDSGIAKNGQKTELFQPGIEIHAKQIVLAEGCRGSVTKQAIQYFELNKHAMPQTYGLGIKEIWQIDTKFHQEGLVMHTIGWPLDKQTYGGSFIYHMADHKIAYGFVVGLDYKNPYFSPFEEAQRFKLHPKLKPIFASGERLNYGAKSLTEGGYQSLPQLTFPGGLIVGDAAGFLNVAKIKGSHNALKSGMLAAKSIFDYFKNNHSNNHSIPAHIKSYQDKINNSDIIKELYQVRNIRPSFHKGLVWGLMYSALDNYVLRGKAPWTLKHHNDHTTLLQITNNKAQKINYPKPDNKITFDRMSSVYLASTHHNEDQPSHLKILDTTIPVEINYKQFGGPEQYYCPAGVYEYLSNEQKNIYLQINAQNCIHCKTCDIKDPKQNINWTTPEGGGGPNYQDM